MDRAGRAVAWEVRRTLGGDVRAPRSCVVCGKGNNGGDGLVAARGARGAGACGCDVVELAAASTGAQLAPRARPRRRRGRRDVRHRLPRRARGRRRWSPTRSRAGGGSVVAVDIPSGVDGLTGAVPGTAVRPTARSPSPRASPASCSSRVVRTPGACGWSTSASTSVTRRRRAPPIAWSTPTTWPALPPPRAPDAHKWRPGVMVVGGSRRHDRRADVREPRGDARRRRDRVVRAPRRRRGRGAASRQRGRSPGRCPPTTTARSRRDAAEAVLADIGGSRALALGPGLGWPTTRRPRWCALVAEARRPAGARRRRPQRARRRPRAAAHAPDARRAPTVLTPHDGEYARLAGATGRRRPGRGGPRAGRPRTGAVVLLKGPGTVVAEPARRPRPVALNTTGGAELATAGTGDVLTGRRRRLPRPGRATPSRRPPPRRVGARPRRRRSGRPGDRRHRPGGE